MRIPLVGAITFISNCNDLPGERMFCTIDALIDCPARGHAL